MPIFEPFFYYLETLISAYSSYLSFIQGHGAHAKLEASAVTEGRGIGSGKFGGPKRGYLQPKQMRQR